MTSTLPVSVVDGLRLLYKTEAKFKLFFDWAASIARDELETDISAFENRCKISLAEARRFGRLLEGLGCGEYIEGRHKRASRMRWKFPLRSLGRAARADDMVAGSLTSYRVGLSTQGEPESQRPLSIEEAKRRLAAAFNVGPDAIEIKVNF